MKAKKLAGSAVYSWLYPASTGRPPRPMRRGHCHVIPFWTAELGKKEWHAFQVSPRTGILYCRMENDRVFIGGKAALYFIASLFLPDGSVTG